MGEHISLTMAEHSQPDISTRTCWMCDVAVDPWRSFHPRVMLPNLSALNQMAQAYIKVGGRKYLTDTGLGVQSTANNVPLPYVCYRARFCLSGTNDIVGHYGPAYWD